ncbi:MAG TPA: GntR family transcriptional regulator [Flavobacteriaceae bacterium]|nr:transcriptional regulator [Flavobacteriaceae bacterium]HIB47874.1 GntR family transcriptional regulator [Flavobacteriaceae bacterium]HIN99396.1 GntR family transcriptional regulator [Flavobacteriaceae bacterium]|tara:strand:- start:7 stop:621 length:615 start_codon:yes stop_codon:yes gene_type:complete
MIEKKIFRNQVREHLISKMRSGELTDGQLVSLAALARELDVSVTPIREALTQLEQSHVVIGVPNRGFMIPKPSAQEAKNVYELIAALEALSIQNSKVSDTLLKKLKTKAMQFSNAKEGLARINADMDFHKALVATYDNPIAIQTIEDLKTRVFFYEKRFMDLTDHQQSVTDHDNIIAALENGNRNQAADIVQKNWLQILTHINL